MDSYKYVFAKYIIAISLLLFTMNFFNAAEASLILTDDEKAYLEEKKTLKAVSIEGIAPIIYLDPKGEVYGISKNVINEISSMTGLAFEYGIYASVEEALESDFDIFVGIPANYAPDNMVLSQPFLKSKTILYINSSMDSSKLDDKIYAAVRGSALPSGIKDENSIFFDTREESLNAVESGKADYGYGNAYSVSFYTIQNNYKNIVTIPSEKEQREYCMGFVKEDDLLISIINKSISAIDEEHMQSIILDATLHIERRITIPMIADAYGAEIMAIVFITICVLLFTVVSYMNINRKLSMRNKRHEMLSQISNEYLYEYSVKDDSLELSEKCVKLFGRGAIYNESAGMLRDILLNRSLDVYPYLIKLPLENGRIGVFKAVNSSIYDDKGKIDSIIGKLIDVTEDVAEKEELIIKSRIDGLTGLYNAATTKELIIERIRSREGHRADILILMDCDNFKCINDSLGHLTGNRVLENISKSLRDTFRGSDIIGRIGGDEFCVYLKDVSSVEFIQSKCRQLNNAIRKETGDIDATVSMGAVLSYGFKTYEDIFRMADDALYQAKRRGGDQLFVYNDKSIKAVHGKVINQAE